MKLKVKGLNEYFNDEFTYKIIIVFLGVFYWIYGFMPLVHNLFHIISVICFIKILFLYIKFRLDFTMIFPIIIVFSCLLTMVFNSVNVANATGMLYIMIETILLVHCNPNKTVEKLQREFYFIAKSFIFIGSVIILVSLCTYFLGISKQYFYPSILNTPLLLGRSTSTNALTGIMANSNMASNFFLIYLGFLLYLIGIKGIKKRFVLCFGLDIVALYYTFSRGAYIGTIVLLGTCLLLNLWRKFNNSYGKLLLKLLVLFLGISVVFLLFFADVDYIVGMVNITGRDTGEMGRSTLIRFMLWETGIRIALSSITVFLFGVGVDIKEAVRSFDIIGFKEGYYSNLHSVYLQTLVGLGFIGLFLFLIYVLKFVFQSIVSYLKHCEKLKDVIPIIGLCLAILIVNLVENDMYVKKTFEGTIFWVCCGYLNRFSNNCSEKC